MLNAYVLKEDINMLLNEMESMNGLVNRNELQQAILKLKEYKEPKPEKKYKINNARELIANITRYQNCIKNNPEKSCLISFFEKKAKKSYVSIYIQRYGGMSSFIKLHFLDEKEDIPECKLAHVLRVSEKTIYNWRERGLIKPSYTHIDYVHSFYHYKISEIKNILKRYK